MYIGVGSAGALGAHVPTTVMGCHAFLLNKCACTHSLRCSVTAGHSASRVFMNRYPHNCNHFPTAMYVHVCTDKFPIAGLTLLD